VKDSVDDPTDDHPGEHADLSALRVFQAGDDADECMHFLLRLSGLRRAVASEARPLLRVLFLRHSPLSACPTLDGVLRARANGTRLAPALTEGARVF
jgi:hypothetical protein